MTKPEDDFEAIIIYTPNTGQRLMIGGQDVHNGRNAAKLQDTSNNGRIMKKER